jgi:hypothetical protein
MRLTTFRPSIVRRGEVYPDIDLDGHSSRIVLRDGTEFTINEYEHGAWLIRPVSGELNIALDNGGVVLRDGSKIDLNRTYTSNEQRWYDARDMTSAELAAGDKVWSPEDLEYVVIVRIEEGESSRRIRTASGTSYDIKRDDTVLTCQEIRYDAHSNTWDSRRELPASEVRIGDKVWRQGVMDWAVVESVDEVPGGRAFVFVGGGRKTNSLGSTVDVCPVVRD